MSKRKNKNIFRLLFSVTGVIILTKIVGFIKQMITAQFFGANIETDLISLSEGFISNAEYGIVQTIITAFVAVYIYVKKNGENEAKKFVSNVLTLLFFISCVISIVIIILAPWISAIIAPSYNVYLSNRLTVYIRFFSPVFIFVVVRSVFQATLNANEKYIVSELTGFNQSIIIICLTLLLAGAIGVKTLALSSYVCAIFNFLFLRYFSKRFWKLQKGNPLKDKNVIRMVKMMLPLLIGYSMIFINQQIDKIIVSALGEGTVTAMQYGSVLSNLVISLIASLCSVLFTRLTYYISNNKKHVAGKFATKFAILLIYIFLPISIITIFGSKDIVYILFGRGAFDNNAIQNAGVALAGYGFCFVPNALKSLFARFQYGAQNTRTPMINSTIGILVNIILSIILSRFLGVFGVTFASSCAEMISAILNIYSAKRKNSEIILRPFLSHFLFVVMGGMFTILAIYLINRVCVNTTAIIRLCLTVIIGMISFYSCCGWKIYKCIKE